jgi:hypothetical protein
MVVSGGFAPMSHPTDKGGQITMPSNYDPDDRPVATGKLSPDQRRALVIPSLGGFGSRFSARDIVYHPLPYNYQAIQSPASWRVELKFGAPAPRLVVGLDIYGDVVLGRGSQGPQNPDIDLSNLEALELGISRRHALLRPTRTQLFLIDLESTNGTYVNAIPVGRGMAQVIRTGDTIALAGLNFVIEIVHSPKSIKPEIATKPLSQSRAKAQENKPETLKLGIKSDSSSPPPPAIPGPLPPISPKETEEESPSKKPQDAKRSEQDAGSS